MKLHFFYFFIFIWISANLYAQVGVDGKPLQAGLYKTLSDFKNNKPSIKGNFVKSENFTILKNRYESMLMEQDSVSHELKNVSEPCWGFASSTEAFIYTVKKEVLYTTKQLCRFELIGRYSVYQEVKKSIQYGVPVNLGDWMLLDVETGVISPLKQKSLISVLKQYPALFAQFQNEKIPMELQPTMKLYISYLDKANQIIK